MRRSYRAWNRGSGSSWPPGRVCAGVVVICRSGVVGSCEHAPPLTSSLNAVEAGTLPSDVVMCPHHRYDDPLRLLTRRRPGFRLRAYTRTSAGCGPPTAGDLPCCPDRFPNIPLPLRRGVPRGRFSRFFAPSMAFAIAETLGSPLLPCGANMSTLQDSLHGTGCWFAPPSQRDTPLRHTGSPQCNGSLLRGSLAMTATGLAPVSCQCLSGHTSGLLASYYLITIKRSSSMVYGGLRRCNITWQFRHTGRRICTQ